MNRRCTLRWFQKRYGRSAGFWAYLAYNEAVTDRIIFARGER